jgi:hypothetical protein
MDWECEWVWEQAASERLETRGCCMDWECEWVWEQAASEQELVDLRTVTRTRPSSATWGSALNFHSAASASETTPESTWKETMDATAPSGNWSMTSACGAILEEEEHEHVLDDALEDDDLDHERVDGVGAVHAQRERYAAENIERRWPQGQRVQRWRRLPWQ